MATNEDNKILGLPAWAFHLGEALVLLTAIYYSNMYGARETNKQDNFNLDKRVSSIEQARESEKEQEKDRKELEKTRYEALTSQIGAVNSKVDSLVTAVNGIDQYTNKVGEDVHTLMLDRKQTGR